jgi:heat-inducible transcriptional repressor
MDCQPWRNRQLLRQDADPMSPNALQQKRHQQILTDVVRAYIETGEPVSSRSVARGHIEQLSPATVRNVMADLEDEGYLYQPHTSAGRVPTAAAYRYFVEQVAAQATASPEDRQWIRRELEAAQTPEAVMERASHVLAAVSRGLGIFISPPLARSVVEHLRFLLLPDNRVLVVLVSTGGVTRDKLVRPERTFRQEDLDRISSFLNHQYIGWTLEAMRADLRLQVERDREQYGLIAGDALLLCDPSILGDSTERKIYVDGAAQIASSPEFTNQAQVRELLEAIEEKDRLIALLSGCIEAPEPVHVELGLDKISNAGKHLALVSSSFSTNDQVQGTLGILAPMRMHYERVITAVAFMSQFFSENSEEKKLS